jgi:hypothetical protein
MWATIIRFCKRKVEIFTLESELEEELEYRRALKSQAIQLPREIDSCTERIVDLSLQLKALRASGKMASPPTKENDHATEKRNVRQDPQRQHPH